MSVTYWARLERALYPGYCEEVAWNWVRESEKDSPELMLHELLREAQVQLDDLIPSPVTSEIQLVITVRRKK